MQNPISGQWLTLFDPNTDQVILDLDDEPDSASGTARIHFSDGSPGAICFVSIPKLVRHHKIAATEIGWIRPDLPVIVPTEEIKKAFPKIDFPSEAKIAITRKLKTY